MTERLTVHQALSKVMGDVQAVKKDSKNQAQRFNFRGIDAVMNAVGPALRKYGVTILPEDVEVHRSNGTTASGKQTATVELDTTGAHTVSVTVRDSAYYTATSTGSIQVN